MALDLSLAEQIEDLAPAMGRETDGGAFFAKNHITAGTRQLFDLGQRRLAGRTDQALFELTQAMGGGKTHTMIAFGLIARDAMLRERVVPDLAGAAASGLPAGLAGGDAGPGDAGATGTPLRAKVYHAR